MNVCSKQEKTMPPPGCLENRQGAHLRFLPSCLCSCRKSEVGTIRRGSEARDGDRLRLESLPRGRLISLHGSMPIPSRSSIHPEFRIHPPTHRSSSPSRRPARPDRESLLARSPGGDEPWEPFVAPLPFPAPGRPPSARGPPRPRPQVAARLRGSRRRCAAR